MQLRLSRQLGDATQSNRQHHITRGSNQEIRWLMNPKGHPHRQFTAIKPPTQGTKSNMRCCSPAPVDRKSFNRTTCHKEISLYAYRRQPSYTMYPRRPVSLIRHLRMRFEPFNFAILHQVQHQIHARNILQSPAKHI
ncbi:hypothetical protein Nepgr_033900 [Nepenthes gracilis]|uniref:Uncharacterized protein n=1 Tax=Nepenthes gracilis TaxID=150966 RepID=A0AAD3Y965_NEPGR|nr:hypothetical protein Nepgr_033900 [Nepenthes gracilis]